MRPIRSTTAASVIVNRSGVLIGTLQESSAVTTARRIDPRTIDKEVGAPAVPTWVVTLDATLNAGLNVETGAWW